MLPDLDPPELGNEDPEFTVLLTVAALNVAGGGGSGPEAAS